MLITNLISRYMKLCKVAFSAGDGAKLTKSIQTSDMEMLFLLMVIPRRCKFTQMGCYGKRGEQCYRQKAGKHTPYVGTFWSGCAGAVKHGIEILGIGVIDVDLHECMMLKTVHTTLGKVEEKNEMNLFDRYARVLEDDKVTLQRICKVLIADSAFSKRPFIDRVLKMGFHVVSRLRRDAALFYTWDGEPMGKPGCPHVKGDKIDVRNINMSKVDMFELEDASGKAYALKAWCKELDTSIDRLKAQMVNAYYAQRIIDVLEKNSNTPLNKERANEIFGFAADAA